MSDLVLGSTALAIAAAILSGSGHARGMTGHAPEAASKSCAAPEYRRLDFWVGAWDAFDVGDPGRPVARARVDLILEGCAVREIYEQSDGLVGQSFTAYDSSRKLWHQTWVTNRGELLQIEGRFRGESLTLEGPRLYQDSRKEIVRAVWRPQTDGVREIAHTSADGGATWQPLFDIVFRRHPTVVGSPANDADTVAALDTEYQAAVKGNDVATIGRILSDDFVLVTGRGRTYNKADLLEEARNKSSVYEHQEEIEQRVRVWGDTAVVTALLWVKGTTGGKPMDYKLWFSDTYVRTPAGWRYVFGQASLALSKEP